jgi:hypothetical protein
VSSRQGTTTITPLGTGVALTTVSQQVVGQNPTRRALAFHNRSSTLSIEIAPAPIVAGNAGSILILPGAWSPTFSGDTAASCAWNAHMVSGTGDITILEWQ